MLYVRRTESRIPQFLGLVSRQVISRINRKLVICRSRVHFAFIVHKLDLNIEYFYILYYTQSSHTYIPAPSFKLLFALVGLESHTYNYYIPVQSYAQRCSPLAKIYFIVISIFISSLSCINLFADLRIFSRDFMKKKKCCLLCTIF